ncbi:MAG: diacylglycerol kinase [Legionella sp.]
MIKVILKIRDASYHSLHGLQAAFQDEFAFRLELLVGVIALPAACFLGNTPVEKALLISTLLLVFFAELLNSAIEITLNRVAIDWHPLTKKAKDISSASVFIAIINALVVWMIIIIPHFMTHTI